MDYLKDIVTNIKDEKCVLIIGPDIVDFGEKSFFETMSNKIIKDCADDNEIDSAPQYVFANEDLLQLLPSAREHVIYTMMKNFYNQQSTFDIPLTKITQIPFHLIISLMPDDRLKNLFIEQKLDYNYNFYRKQGSNDAVERPTKEKPLVYNLLGELRPNYAIITFEHLFTFLSSFLGNKGLPEMLKVTLSDASSFIFLGVNFEKWYVQLLLRLITDSIDKKDKYTIFKKNNINDFGTFIARRHDLKFLETESLQFLDNLYNEFKNQDLLKRKIKVFISYSHIDKESAVELLKQLSSFEELEIVIDDSLMKWGEKIKEFIKIIQKVDIVIPILSENSLLSPWVSKEIMLTLEEAKKPLMSCYIDEKFKDNQIIVKGQNEAKERLNTITDLIKNRGFDDTDDLEFEQILWKDFGKNIPKIFSNINERKHLPFIGNKFQISLDEVLMQIKYQVKND